MKEVLIDGEIGYDWWSDSGVTAKAIQEQLKGIEDGEDIKISINSPGGSVYEGIVIFNLIRDYAKTHPVAVRINCMAMSMASYIALAARTVDKNAKITVSENSVVMIHNPWTFSTGDYRQLKKDADYLEKLAAVYGSVHAAVSGKTEKEIRAAMDDETYYVGKEIRDAGLANDWEKITESGDNDDSTTEIAASAKDTIIINAKLAVNKTIEKAHEAKSKNVTAYSDDLKKAAALFVSEPAGAVPPKKNIHTGASEAAEAGGKMTAEELLGKDKSCYDAIFALGEKAALEKERQRVAAHIRRGEKVGAMDIALKHIQGEGAVTDEAVNEEYFTAAVDAKRIAARNADNPPSLHTGSDDGSVDEESLSAEFAKGARLGKNGLEGGNV